MKINLHDWENCSWSRERPSTRASTSAMSEQSVCEKNETMSEYDERVCKQENAKRRSISSLSVLHNFRRDEKAEIFRNECRDLKEVLWVGKSYVGNCNVASFEFFYQKCWKIQPASVHRYQMKLLWNSIKSLKLKLSGYEVSYGSKN